MTYKIFQIDSSIKPTKDSFTRRTGQYFIRKFQEKFGQMEVNYLDLAKKTFPFVTQDWFDAAMMSPYQRTVSQNELLLNPNLEALRECDLWLLDLPVYMYDVPASFRNWFEHCVQQGLTMDERGRSLLHNKRVVIISAWGERNPLPKLQESLETILLQGFRLIGVEDICFIYVYATQGEMATEEEAHKKINNYISDLQF